jgi:hypothetical protein
MAQLRRCGSRERSNPPDMTSSCRSVPSACPGTAGAGVSARGRRCRRGCASGAAVRRTRSRAGHARYARLLSARPLSDRTQAGPGAAELQAVTRLGW